MSAIDQRFEQLRAAGQKAFIPFLTAGDPDLEFTAAALRELVRGGAAICEVGIPYSDPIADGPVIQASYTRVLARGIHLRDIFAMTGRLHGELAAPLVCMVSYAIVFRHDPARFVAEAKQAGFAGAIVPDLPIDEAEALSALCRREDFSLIQLVTPTTPPARAQRIAATSTGFIYYVSVTGITGERATLPAELADNVRWLREQTATPVCVGFGISRPEHVRLLAPVADGVIVGTALVRRIAESVNQPRDAVLKELSRYAAELSAALKTGQG